MKTTISIEALDAAIAAVRSKRPLVHNITNYVVMNNSANALLAIDEKLSMEDKQRYLKCYKWLRTVMWTDPKTGASSRLTPGVKCAILTEDAEMLKQSQRDCDNCMSLFEYGSSIHKADYVNWTHGCPHNISYGVISLQRALFVASVLTGTPLEFESPKRYNQFDLIKYSYEPAMYRAQGFVMFSGRSTFGIEINFGVQILCAALPMIGSFGVDEDRYIKKFIKRHSLAPEVMRSVMNGCSIYDCNTFLDIMNDESIEIVDGEYEYAHAWFTGDRAAQQRNDYAIGIALSSQREKAWECINSANKTGWHVGDGSTYLYTSYDTHQFDGPNFILNNENVAYRFPGTTEDARKRVARSIASAYEWYPPNSFAGSLQIDERYIVAAMDFVSYNYEGEDIKPDDYGYGGSLPPHKNDLRVKKAWFCFDNEIVCLGAGITSTMDSPVSTTVEHRRVVSEDKYAQYVCTAGEEVAELAKAEYTEEYENPRWVLMEGHAGYVFPSESRVRVNSYIHEPAASQRFFEVNMLHGANPENESYEYVIVPYATPDILNDVYSSAQIEVISNTAALQAVRDNSCGVSGYVFHEAAEIEGIGVDKPCILSRFVKDGVYTISVTDPTHKLDNITITLDGEVEVLDKSLKCSVAYAFGKTKIVVNTFGAHGRRFSVSCR